MKRVEEERRLSKPESYVRIAMTLDCSYEESLDMYPALPAPQRAAARV
jgi:hypothetical protein